jgi:hypothetical protein
MRFISQFWNGSKAIARRAGSNDLQLFDLKEKETTEAAVAFDADFDIARAVIFNAGGEFQLADPRGGPGARRGPYCLF